MYFLDCPYADKDEVKSLGAKWHSSERKWYVPVELHDQMPIFNQWTPNGRIFLWVPYAEKDAAKANGARWDATVKLWYCSRLSPKLEQWTNSRGKEEQVPESPVPSSSSKPKKKASARRGNAEQAARIQISDAMTVKQLQDECRYRGVKGLSGKSKTWLLDQLGVGTLWLSHPSAAVASSKKSSPATKGKKSPAVPVSNKQKAERTPKGTKGKAVSSKKTSAPKKRPANDSLPAKSSIDWSHAPRINSQMTIAQLSHELLKRDPSAKGLSSKPKSWFLSKLGENSVWTTSPSINAANLIGAPVVSKSLTNAQLMHEIMARTPGKKGLSSKSKDDLISMVGIGSIWMTGSTTTSTTKQKAPPAKKVKKEKATPKPSRVVAPETVTSSRADCIRAEKLSSSRAPSSTVSSPPKQTAPENLFPVCAKPSSCGSKPVAKRNGTTIASQFLTTPSVVHPAAASLPSIPSEHQKNQIVPVKVKSSTNSSAKSAKKTVATKKKAQPKKAPIDLSIVNASMTIAQLLEEIRYRNPNVTGLSGKNKKWLIAELGQGTPVLGVKADADAKALHVHTAPFFPHPLADSSLLRAPRHCGPYDRRKRVDTAICNVDHPLVCTNRPFRSSEPYDYDICKACFDIESLPERERNKKLSEINKRLEEIRRERQIQLEKERRDSQARWEKRRREEEARWRKEEEERERARQKDLLRFTTNITRPSKAHTDKRRKKKFTVWTKETHPSQDICASPEFDSSYDSLKDANLRVEYLFFYSDHWDQDKENVYTKEDDLLGNKFRYLMTENDYGETYTVSAIPSDAFDSLDSLQNFEGDMPEWSRRCELADYLRRDSFPTKIRNPPKQNVSGKTRQGYTVWTSHGYEDDGWHSYDGPSNKEFNSSFASLEDANRRAEFVFYFDNPWGLGLDEMSPAETDGTTSTGLRLLNCAPDDSGSWTVSVVPSSAFPFLNIF